jgi:hypothetical protein
MYYSIFGKSIPWTYRISFFAPIGATIQTFTGRIDTYSIQWYPYLERVHKNGQGEMFHECKGIKGQPGAAVPGRGEF